MVVVPVLVELFQVVDFLEAHVHHQALQKEVQDVVQAVVQIVVRQVVVEVDAEADVVDKSKHIFCV